MDFKDKPQIVECFADANFAGAWDNTDPDEASNVISRTRFLIKFANCPIFWSSKQQELTALSTVEAEYIALSSASRHVLFIPHLLEDLKELHIDSQLPETKVYAKCFKDNAGCLELAKSPKLRPSTKHITVKLHHVLGYVKTDANQMEFWSYIGFPQTDKNLMDSPKPWDPFCLSRSGNSSWDGDTNTRFQEGV